MGTVYVWKLSRRRRRRLLETSRVYDDVMESVTSERLLGFWTETPTYASLGPGALPQFLERSILD